MNHPIPEYSGTTFELTGALLKEIQRSGYNYFVYILECADKSYYVGLTNDLETRLKEHTKGENVNSYTYKRRPVTLKYFELYHIIQDAIDRENQLKKWSRKKKEALFCSDVERLKELSKSKTEIISSTTLRQTQD